MNIRFEAAILSTGGYQELARNIITVLDKMGVLSQITIRDAKAFHPLPLESAVGKDFIDLLMRYEKPSVFREPDVLIQMVPPFVFRAAKEKEKVNIGITMFEAPLPITWNPYMEKTAKLDQLWLHDEFQDSLFKDTNIKKLRWNPHVTPPLPSSAQKPVNPFALTVGVSRVHKNQGKLAKLWGQDLPIPYDLVLKQFVEDQSQDEYRYLESDVVHIIPGHYTTQGIDNLYQNCSWYLGPSMCEGLNMPAVKALMCGKPILVGAHTSHTDWCPKEFMFDDFEKIDMSIIPNIHPCYKDKDCWGYDVPLEDLKYHLNNLSGRERICAEKAKEYSEVLKQKFSQEACEKSIKGLLNGL